MPTDNKYSGYTSIEDIIAGNSGVKALEVADVIPSLNLSGGLSDAYLNNTSLPSVNANDTTSGLSISGLWDSIGGLAGMKEGLDVAGDVYGLYSAFAGPGHDLFNAQMDKYGAQTDLLKQQLASNKQSMADTKTFNTNWANASNGLAGQSATKVS